MRRREVIRASMKHRSKLCGLADMLKSPALVQRNAAGITITPLQFIPMERDVL